MDFDVFPEARDEVFAQPMDPRGTLKKKPTPRRSLGAAPDGPSGLSMPSEPASGGSSPDGSPRGSPGGSPKNSPKNSPRGSPRGSPKAGARDFDAGDETGEVGAGGGAAERGDS